MESSGSGKPFNPIRTWIRLWTAWVEEYKLVRLSESGPDMFDVVRPSFETEFGSVVPVADAGVYKSYRASYDLCREEFDVAPYEVVSVRLTRSTS